MKGWKLETVKGKKPNSIPLAGNCKRDMCLKKENTMWDKISRLINERLKTDGRNKPASEEERDETRPCVSSYALLKAIL